MAEERGLAPAGVPRAEDVDAEELQKRDRGGYRRPEHESADDDRQVVLASHEQRNCDCEQPVLHEFRVADEMVREECVVE